MNRATISLTALLLSTYAVAGCEEHLSTEGYIAGTGVYVREAPSTSANPLTIVNFGTHVTVLERGKCESHLGRPGRWVKVRTFHSYDYQTPTEYTGWVFDPNLAYGDMFVRVREWRGISGLESCTGDACDMYTLNQDGTFLHYDADGYANTRGLETKGYIFQYKSIILLRVTDVPPTDVRGFTIFRDSAGEHCDERYLNASGVCEFQ